MSSAFKTKKPIYRDRDVIAVVPTPGTSRAEDMAQRDRAAEQLRSVAGTTGVQLVVNLHVGLDDDEIVRVINRWSGSQAQFVIDKSDSTPNQRTEFRRRWMSLGGPSF